MAFGQITFEEMADKTAPAVPTVGLWGKFISVSLIRLYTPLPRHFWSRRGLSVRMASRRLATLVSNPQFKPRTNHNNRAGHIVP